MEAARGYYMVSLAVQPFQQEVLQPFKTDEFKWATVSLHEVLSTGGRLEASVFNIEGRQAREILQQCKWPKKMVCGQNGMARAWHRARFKRLYVAKSDYPIYQPSQINEIYPKPADYISIKTQTDIDSLRVAKNQILLTCSGTVGNCTIVGNTLDGKIFSHDLIRIDVANHKEVGYLYAFLKSKTGHTLINTNNYGAVVDHIEPEHLANIPIPDPSPIIKQRIHDLIMESFRLRDESNALMDEAQALLKGALKLPNIEEFKPTYFNANIEFQNFSVNIAQLDGRFEASYHVPIVDFILKHLAVQAKEVTYVGDSQISKKILMPGIFKRTYVEEGQGTVLIGGKNLLELDPSNKKYLRLHSLPKREIENLIIHENMVLITSRGTIGKVNIVPKHWEGWAASNNTVHVEAQSNEMAGYLYAWLASEWAYPLILRLTYGAVVDMIDVSNVAEIPIPLLHNPAVQKTINDKVLEANRKRFEAYELEQKALKIMDEKVIFEGV
jgi:type I restriction enzyme S subunit